MKQQDFESVHAARWEQFSAWLDQSHALRPRRGPAEKPTIEPSEVPARYRELCQHLALARDRQYSAELIERLSRLALAGHQRLYGAHGNTRSQVAAFLLRGFPAAVRAQLPFVLVACLLFFGPLLVLTGALQHYPDFAYVVIPPDQVESFGEMYGDEARSWGASARRAMTRSCSGSISGTMCASASRPSPAAWCSAWARLFYLLFNGLFIGTVTGYVVY